MKLIQATSKSYFVYALIAFGIGGVVSFFMIKTALYEEVDEALFEQLHQVKKALTQGDDIPEAWPHALARDISPTALTPSDLQWKDTLIYHEREAEYQPFRQLTSIQRVNEQNHQIILRASLIEADDLIEAIGFALAMLFVLLLTGLLLINRRLLKRLWAPFFHTLDQLKGFRLTEDKKLTLTPSPITEFQQLNQVLADFSQQAQQDFEAVKAFTENASHEIQTPLAAALLELDVLVQKEDLSEAQLQHIEHVNHALRRLSRLNEGLLLLTKIENRQFNLEKKVELKSLLLSVIGRFQELAEAKGKAFQTTISNTPHLLKGSPVLFEMMFDNLLKNAIRHSSPGSSIQIILNEKEFRISNWGDPFEEDGKWLFQRFSKGNSASSSLGLGLAICREICAAHHLTLQYAYLGGKHCFYFPIESE